MISPDGRRSIDNDGLPFTTRVFSNKEDVVRSLFINMLRLRLIFSTIMDEDFYKQTRKFFEIIGKDENIDDLLSEIDTEDLEEETLIVHLIDFLTPHVSSEKTLRKIVNQFNDSYYLDGWTYSILRLDSPI